VLDSIFKKSATWLVKRNPCAHNQLKLQLSNTAFNFISDSSDFKY